MKAGQVSLHAAEVAEGRRFEFGANWTRFLETLDDRRVAEAELSLRTMLGRERLDGLTFLDIGSGSGLFSLAARRLGEEAGLSLREVRHEPTHIHTRVHILARRLARLARQRGSTPLGAPAFTDQVRNRDRGFALLAVYGRS